MDILNAEEKICSWVERVAQMEGKVYRCTLPGGEDEGVEVKIISGTPGTSDKVNEFTLEVAGFSLNRKELWEKFEKICAGLPLQGKEGLLFVKLKDEVTFGMKEKKGRQLFSVRALLHIAFV